MYTIEETLNGHRCVMSAGTPREIIDRIKVFGQNSSKYSYSLSKWICGLSVEEYINLSKDGLIKEIQSIIDGE